MSESNGQHRRIEVYDTTLRDGTQGEGVALSLVDKLKISRLLDDIGVDFIEGGYPLSNPKDVAFFEEAAKLPWKHAKVVAFGMTRRKDTRAQDDPGMQALVAAGTPVITIVGKTWDLHVDEVLRVSREENLAMIRDSVAFCKSEPHVTDVFYDAEHFFDGYDANPKYATQTVLAAVEGGASRIVLCDTNGGSLPERVALIVDEIRCAVEAAGHKGVKFGIHTHNDAGCAVANAMAAVRRGCVQVQGTINGIGERCGNVDLITLVANLHLKMKLDCLAPGKADASVARLTEVSRFVYEVANLGLWSGQPYVGSGAFAHKGGMHVHAVQRIAHSYEHVPPESVGNERRVLMSELGGASGVAATIGRKFNLDDKATQRRVIARVAELENQGYQFEAATASFELLVHDVLGARPRFWELDHYRCVIFKRGDEATPSTEATVKLSVGDAVEHRVAEGDGPVNALDGAMRKCLLPHYPRIADIHLTDFKVRVVNPTAESAAKVRVIAEFAAKTEAGVKHFSTIGVNENVVDASWQAIVDAFAYHLIETTGVEAKAGVGP